MNNDELTREQRLLMQLARASSAGKQSRSLEQFFAGLDNAGWLVELARVHLRLCTGVAQPHRAFALALQLREGRQYRLALIKDDDVRARLVDLARVALKLDGEQAITRLQRTAEFQRLQRSLSFAQPYGDRRRGRALGESFYVSDAAGEELEALRIRARLKIKHFAVQIGTSENTYRRRLDEGATPPEWLANARVVVARSEDALLQRRRDDLSVTDAELTFAFGRVWQSYGAQSNRLIGLPTATAPESPKEKAARQAREDEAILEFTPSEEEDLDLEIGAVDETERAVPENRDE